VAVGAVWLLVGVQLIGARPGIRFSDALTALKVVGVIGFILAAAAFGRGDPQNLTTVSLELVQGTSRFGALATSLIFVMFCYSGWNASAYMAAEFENPQRDLARSLILGTGIVVVLYLGLNVVYFYGADVAELAGVVEVGLVAARNLFGPTGVTLVTSVLCLSLLASATAMTIAGPRVYYALGSTYPALGFLARVDRARGSPVAALLLQGLVASAIVVTGRIDQIMQYAGFTLTLFGSLAVSCVIVLRIRRPEMPRPFRTWGYPFTPLLFLSVSAWTLLWAIRGRPVESLLGLLTVGVGGLVFWLTVPRRKDGPSSS
jgi:APA family basic amino acid/polyamine antiporter